ncbi:MAG: HEAT repeat domain-containing protein [Actinobacteria bacterium]|nr:HEAT repeat domain-containing protein [Actinomycetota bacterium]
MTAPTSGEHGVEGISPAEISRRREAALGGHLGDEAAVRPFLADPSPRVRATALWALGRLDRAGDHEVATMLDDPEAMVRRRACEMAVRHPEVDLVPLLGDHEPTVVEAAAWALGERGAAENRTVAALAGVAGGHGDALCREAAVAALGAIGDDAGLPAILAAIEDKPAIRRRAVIALAPFEGDEVDIALQRALDDRDWQVRQAAEDLLDAGVGRRSPDALGNRE